MGSNASSYNPFDLIKIWKAGAKFGTYKEKHLNFSTNFIITEESDKYTIDITQPSTGGIDFTTTAGGYAYVSQNGVNSFGIYEPNKGVDFLNHIIANAVLWNCTADGSMPFKLLNPAGTFAYTLQPSAITANRVLTVPLLTADDTITTNSQLQSERTGKSTASGNGTTTVFTIAHGLGSTPSYVFVDCSSHAIARTFTVDGTNITVTFASAPSSGTNNVIIYWRVIA